MALNVSSEAAVRILMKSTPDFAIESTAASAASGSETPRRKRSTGSTVPSLFIRSTFFALSRILPGVLMRGPSRLPSATSFRHFSSNSASPPISRTLVTPLAMNSGKAFSPAFAK